MSATPPVIGTTMTALLDDSTGVGTIAVVLFGISQAQIPTNLGGDLLVTTLGSFGLTLVPGANPIDVDIEDDPSLCGAEFFAQALELDGGATKGVSFTAGLKLVVGT